MRRTLRFLPILFAFISPLAFAQAPVQQRDCPGVPGACGYQHTTNTPPSNAHVGGPNSNPTPQNGNHALGQIYSNSACGLNFATASQRLGKRFSPAGVNQPAPFVISGIPACASILRAYLWAEGSGNGAAQTATIVNPASVTTNYPMAIVGNDIDKCWGYAGTYTYRADVTTCITGNGTYNISGLLTNPPTSGNDMDGATLIVIYSDPTQTWRGNIHINDGAYVVNGGTASVNMTYPAVCGATTNAQAFCCIGDIQMAGQTLTMNGTNSPFTWNWWNYVQNATTVAVGQTTSNFTLTSGGDCFNLCVIGMYYRTTCTTCTSSSLTLTPASTPASCSACNGTATIAVTGGSPPYTYSWAPSGGTGSTATNLCAGTYTVTVTANGGCLTQTATVTVPGGGGSITVNSGGQTNILCNGQCTGSATATPVGGTAPYTYSWAPSGGTGSSATGLCAGTYTVTVTDAGGCVGTRTFNITQPPALTATQGQTNVLCNGQCTGSATVTPSGGTPPYSYSWAPSGGTGSTTTGRCAGTYTVTITDANGCVITRSFTITQPPALSTTGGQTNVLCNGLCTGSATVTPSGGTPPYTYSWAPSGGTGSTTTGRCAGTYTVTVTDANGCTTTRTFNITQPPALSATGAQTNILCNGQCTGSATVTPSGGTPPYTYSWAPSGGTGSTTTGRCAGTYTATVTDANGCTVTQSFNITQPPALTTTGGQTNILCNGQCTGSATVTPSGGTAPYSYSWAPSGGTGSTTTGRCAGTYTVTVTDANGCTTTRTFAITQPTAITATTSATNASCGNANGSATVNPSGGTPTYTYLWTPSGQTTQTATGLLAGAYSVLVTDANGCTATFSVTVNNSGSPTANIPTFTNVTCFGLCNGTANSSVSGGATPYTYSWAPSGGTGANATGLCAGSYTLTVTDANGCTATATVTITQPTQLTATGAQTNILCNGQCTGSATVTPSGGTPPYTYAWAPSGGTGASTSGRCAGTYTATVTDANGCTVTQTFNITQPPALTVTPSQTNILCNGQCTGSATVTPGGGTAPYSYNWAPSGGTSSSAGSLCAGSYTATVTDANGCVITQTFNITQPSAITGTTSSTNSTCGNANGTATVTPGGGTPIYTYLWSPGGQTTQTATGLLAGPYTVLVTDANGCTATFSVTVNNAGSPTATIPTFTNVTCFGLCDGTANGSASGGTAPYTYSWAPSGGTGANATGLCAGTYTLTVTDANGCTATATVTITQPTQLTATGAQLNILCNGQCTGSATVTPSGGTPPYTYAWAPSGGTGASASALCAGNYTCTITDANNCTVTQTFNITQPPALTVTPSQTDVTCNGACNGSATVTPGGGTAPYSYNWAPVGGTGATANGLCAGSYTATVTDANGCVITQIFTITQPTPITATTSSVNSTCGNANGTATVNPSGGTPTYTVVWSDPGAQTTLTATGLLAGPYTVIVTDANGCVDTFSVTVNNSGSPTLAVQSSTNVTCFGACDGSATVAAAGGTPPYTYNWTPSGGTGTTANGLCAGTYICTVTDANGCTAVDSVTITEPPQLTNTSTSTDALCFGSCDGTASVTASGGTPPYSYNWLPSGGTGSSANNLCAGTYTVTITDANGCTINDTITINEPTPLALAIAGFDATCNGACDGQVVVIPSGGNSNYSFSWNPNTSCNQPSCSNVCAGTYTVTVTDGNGCVDTASATVNEPPAITTVMSSTTAHCNQADGSATVAAAGGTGTLDVLWSPGGQTTATATNLLPGTYVVTITDDNGCTHTDSVTVPNAPGVGLTLTSSVNASCFGVCDGSATVTASSGTGTYTYNWSPSGGNAATATGLCAGVYVCTVTDSAGCTASVTVTISEPTQLTVAAVAPVSLCNGQNTLMNCTPAGGTPVYTYNWTPGNIGTQSGTVTPTATTTYTVTVTDANGCTATASSTVTINPVPTAAFTSDQQSGCVPLTVQFTDGSSVATPGNIVSWSWDFGDGTGSTQNPSHTYATPGVYTVILTVTTGDGCTHTITMANYVSVYAIPVAEFSAGPQPTTNLNPEICFTDESIGAATWSWSFGDLLNSGSILQSPCFTYPDTGCFDVVLTVTSVEGCVNIVTHPVCITPDYTMFIPNTFTPNGDGSNDLFFPKGAGIDLSTFEMWIFDRWGNMIYYTDDLNKGWDGRANGGSDVAQVDTYVYKIRAKDFLETKHQYIGHVNLIK